MQIGIGGAAGDAYDPLRQYLPNPALGPHDPTTAIELAALVLIKDKGAPTGQPIDAYLPYARAYNGTGPAADAYAARVIADAHSYQGSGQTTFVGETTGARPRRAAPATSTPSRTLRSRHRASTRASTTAAPAPIDALGPGRVVLVSTTDTGWGNGDGWVSYQLTGGAYAGDYVYVAEGITPTVRQGQLVAAGPADRHLQRPLDRDRLRARPRRPRPRAQRLPRRSRHRRRADHEPAARLARRAQRSSRPDQLRRTMPHRRGSDTEHGPRAAAVRILSSSIAHPEPPQRGKHTLPT